MSSRRATGIIADLIVSGVARRTTRRTAAVATAPGQTCVRVLVDGTHVCR